MQIYRRHIPSKYRLYTLDIDGLKKQLQGAAVRGNRNRKAGPVIQFPDAEGRLSRFRVFEAPVLSPGLSARYPGIRSYAAQGIDDPTATLRFSISRLGLNAMILSGNAADTFIDPVTRDRKTCMVYDRSALEKTVRNFECLTPLQEPRTRAASLRTDTNDGKLRSFRLALSCTGEYASLFKGEGTEAAQKANVLAQMVVTMTRVNAIYERDLAVTLVLVDATDQIIFLDPDTDPWTSEWNNTTQATLDAVIGSANYDIGHNFNTTGGGNAGCIGCVCRDGSKGSAYTGRSDPTGDPFDIDYVAHEMGHQFGGYHTMNTCERSGSGTTEVEPASGSSIMGYAGICPVNVQENSDAHFNYVNIRDIAAYVQSGTGGTCGTIIEMANQPPTADAGPDYAIPPSTPFVLRGSGSDPDGTGSLTFNWASNDPEKAPTEGAPLPTWTTGPMARSILPSTSPDRYLPSIEDVAAGNLTPTWEVTPSVARTLDFSFVVRDNAAGGGQTASDLMTVTIAPSDPFLATDITGPWETGTTEMIYWNIGSTHLAPIDCNRVAIRLSLDGGRTFPVTLAADTPNDGTEAVTVPQVAGNACRVKVEAADSIFYAVTPTDFTIAGSGTLPDLTVSPDSGFAPSGGAGGPFSPDSETFVLQNQSPSSLDFSVSHGQSWISVTPASGTLNPGQALAVTLSLTPEAALLEAGNYTDTLTFTSSTGSGDTTRNVVLTVHTAPRTQYFWNLSTDPGWTIQGLWAWGIPSGGGGAYGGPDPAMGHTGDSVLGYNLDGDYPNNLPATHLTSTAIDCTGMTGVTLAFRRWLGVEAPTWDHAVLAISTNGTDWSTVWENTEEITDTSWQYQEFDISAIADDQPAVYLRWSMGPTDSSWQYCGWNIDDIAIIAVGEPLLPACPGCPGSAVVLEGMTFGSACTCTATESITLGEGLVIGNGATLILKAPIIRVSQGAVVEEGATLKASP